jgi:DNA-binding NarL/FixJ family response regulator
MAADDLVAAGASALGAGRWEEARARYEAAVAEHDTGEACHGLATALWWLGENQASVDWSTRAYARYRRAGDEVGAVNSALWLALTYKANFANFAAANGWIARAQRLLDPIEPGPSHGWLWITRAYRMPDLTAAEGLTRQAIDVARAAADVDLEVTAASQLGLILVGQGDVAAGFALIDEAMAAALSGEPTSLATVVYACCDMLNACDLTSDADRAAQWCVVADGFVSAYGCPFLYAECRIHYGSVLSARGRWVDAERELATGLRMTEDTCPGLHHKALARLASLRIRQGRLEDAERLLAEVGGAAAAEAEATLSVAALALARGDGAMASRLLALRWRNLEVHRSHLASALDLLVDAHLTADDVDAAASAAVRLTAEAEHADSDRLRTMAMGATGRVAIARGDDDAAMAQLTAAMLGWSRAALPFEAARVELDLGRALAHKDRDVAVDHARRALAAFTDLGAAAEADRVAAFLRSLGVVARTGPKRVGHLSAREQEVLALVGRGLTNPEIAGRLSISRKTASHHVSSILSKLNLRNRAEVAAYAAARMEGDPAPR